MPLPPQPAVNPHDGDDGHADRREGGADGNGIYQVDVFIDASSTNAQSPEGAQTTVTYRVTLDENSGWQITDVGGALPLK